MTTSPDPSGDDVACQGCGSTATAAEVAGGWTVSRSPRPVGADRPRTPAEERTTALCPDCSRRHLRDLEARLDP